MKSAIKGIRNFFATMGLVEQSQVVASTAVVVAMGTMVAAHLATGQTLEWLDFLSVVTVGVIGYLSVLFSLKYGRMLEEQRRELLELNTIAEAVNHSVELQYVLQSALIKVLELMRGDFGWIYLYEHPKLELRHRTGTDAEFYRSNLALDDLLSWMKQPSVLPINHPSIQACTTDALQQTGSMMIASIPLILKGEFAGVMILASRDARKFQSKKIALLQAFGNQISVALSNASLFEQVKQSERRYADLYENSPDMYHSVQADGTIISCNRTEVQVLGRPKEAVIGRHLLDLYPESQHEHVHSNLSKLFKEGVELRGVEEKIARADGTLLDVSVNASLVYDEQGKPYLARMVLRDITEKKKMEEKILQVQKIDSIGNLAGGIAHDFNNILTGILGSASIMRRKVKDDPRWLKYVELIETTSRRGAAITRQLLTFARKNNSTIQMVDIRTIIDQTLHLFEATTPKNIHIKYTPSNEALIVKGDEGQLQQALLNLLLNARDAMENGGVLIVSCKPAILNEAEASLIADARAGEHIVVTITDSGIGIAPEIIEKIYEPFFTTKEQGKGTGLGLSVVYGVVRSHNGCITVSSEVNSGTTFSMYFPRVSSTNISRLERTRTSDLVGGNERILLVEDEVSIGEINSDLLRDLGYQVTVVENGREAVDLLSCGDQEFDLVILDMNMPRMGGREAFQRIKEIHPRMRVLVCSGYSAAMVDDGKFAELIDGFVQKPYELDEICAKIRTILSQPVRYAGT